MKSYSLRFGSGDPRTFTGLSPTMLIFVRLPDGQTIAPPSITESLASSGLYQFQFGTTQPIAFLADAATLSPGTTGRYVTGQIDPSDRTDEYASTMIALGMTGVAIGTSGIALGTSIYALEQALGSTIVGIGNTAIALGTSNGALGLTNVAIGTSIYALEQSLGSTLVAIGNTGIGLGSSIYGYIGSTASIIGGISSWPVDLFGYLKRIDTLLEGPSQYLKGVGQLSLFDLTGATTLSQRTLTNNVSLVTKT